jgi:hypothetical protein
MRRAPVLLAVALVFALAGCGGGKVSPDKISGAAAKTSRAGSLKADFTVSGPGAKATGSGVFNTKDRSGKLSMELEVNRRKSTLETIVTGNVLYMRSRVFAQAGLSGAREWVKLDLAALARQRGIDLSSLVNASPTPSSVLGYLGGAGTVEKVGSESVQGVKTTHYRVTADLQRAAARANGNTRESIKRVIRLSGLKQLPVDTWIDGDGYLRKVSWAEHTSRQQAARVTMELHDFGSPVAIKPPAGPVVDLLKRLAGG